MTDTLADFLRTRTLLLVLDNCEHLRTACQGLVDHLLRTSATVRILTTSREALGVESEATYRVPPLSLPDARHMPPLAQVTKYDAIGLFAERAALSKPGFAVVAGNASAIVQICQRLDGIPLALEFAAARVAGLPVEQIAARLDDQFRLFTAGPRKALPRQQTLRATLDWSHDLLSQREQTLFRRLSVFAGGLTLEAAEKICAGNGVGERDILDLLTRLVDKSLIVLDEWEGPARYRLLESVRQYGRERLEDSGEADQVQRRHRDWYLEFAEEADSKLRGHEQDVWLDRLEAEHDNLRAALTWSKITEDVEAWLRFASAMTWFWYINGHWREGRRWLEDGLSAGESVEPSALFGAVAGGALFAQMQGDTARERELTEKERILGERLGENSLLLRGRVRSGNLAINLGEVERGVGLLEEGVAPEYGHRLAPSAEI